MAKSQYVAGNQYKTGIRTHQNNPPASTFQKCGDPKERLVFKVMNTSKISISLLFALLAMLLVSCKDDMPANIANTFAGMLAIGGEVVLALLAMLTGVGMIILGCWLTYLGYSGDFQLLIKGNSLEASLVNATPGALLIVLGVIVILWRAKINIKIRK